MERDSLSLQADAAAVYAELGPEYLAQLVAPLDDMWAAFSGMAAPHALLVCSFRHRHRFSPFSKPMSRETVHLPTDTRTEQLYEMFGNRALYQDGWKAVSLHGQRMPWFLGSVTSFDDDVWELCDDMVSRIGKQQYRLFGDRKEFIYDYPGAHHIAEKASPPVKGRSHDIEVTLDVTGAEDGVIACCGGMTGGYSLFIKDGRLYYDYNYYDGVYYTLVSPVLEKGTLEARMRFIKTSNEGGRGELWINGKKVDACPMPKVHLSTFSLSETFDVGRDSGTQVSKIYRGQSHFVGNLDKVTFRLTDADESPK